MRLVVNHGEHTAVIVLLDTPDDITNTFDIAIKVMGNIKKLSTNG